MVVHHIMHEGVMYREIIENSYRTLAELKVQYDDLGFKTWINLYGDCAGQWVLTIKLPNGCRRSDMKAAA